VSRNPEGHLACHHPNTRLAREHCRQTRFSMNGHLPDFQTGEYWLHVAAMVRLGVVYV
jgi:hypothetical protein